MIKSNAENLIDLTNNYLEHLEDLQQEVTDSDEYAALLIEKHINLIQAATKVLAKKLERRG
jgi:hypothetical protein